MQVFGKNRGEKREIKGGEERGRKREMIIFFLSLVWFAQKWKKKERKEKKKKIYIYIYI